MQIITENLRTKCQGLVLDLAPNAKFRDIIYYKSVNQSEIGKEMLSSF